MTAPVELSLSSVFGKIEEALADLRRAEEATPAQAELYLKRARTAMHYAQTRAQATLARWREYDAAREGMSL